MLNFLKYDPETGVIVSKGYMDPNIVNKLIADGEPYVRYSGPDIDINSIKFDIDAGNIVEIVPTPPPAPVIPRVLSFIAFMGLFTETEQIGIVESTDPKMGLFKMMATGAGIINMDDPTTAAGINYMASLKIIKDERVAEILSMTPPK